MEISVSFCISTFLLPSVLKEFGELRQGSDGTYFINVQQSIEKLLIKQSSLLLKQNVAIDAFDVSSGHQRTSCKYKLFDKGSEVVENLEDLESSLSDEIEMTLVCIAGYVTRNDNQSSECENNFYYEKYRPIHSIDHGKLKVPSDHTQQ